MIVATLFGLIAICIIVQHIWLRKMRQAVANLPGPYCLPILGLISEMLLLKGTNLLTVTQSYYAKYGNMFRFWIFHRMAICCADLELNEQLFISQQHISKQRNYSLMSQWLGQGLLLSNGPKWFARRKVITPTFHFKILEQFVEVFDQQTTTLIDRLAREADGRTVFDVNRFVCAATLDIIVETAMGTKVYAQSDAGTPYANAVRRMTQLLIDRFLKVHCHNELIFRIMCPRQKLEQVRLIRIMHDFTRKVITDRRRVLEQSLQDAKGQSTTEDHYEVDGVKKRMALLDVLLQSTINGQPLSDEDIREEVETFMFEGHDTTSSAISFTLQTISRHPEVQEKLLDEVRFVQGDVPRPLTMHDLSELKYTECVIKETLRLYPSVPIIGREIYEDFKYTHSKFGDGVIPAGTEFFIDIYGMMRNASYWRDPNAFLPERHENTVKMGAFMFVPFSAGPRNCIGQKFAMLEMKMTIAKVVREFELLPLGSEPQLDCNLILHSSNGWQLGMRRRV